MLKSVYAALGKYLTSAKMAEQCVLCVETGDTLKLLKPRLNQGVANACDFTDPILPNNYFIVATPNTSSISILGVKNPNFALSFDKLKRGLTTYSTQLNTHTIHQWTERKEKVRRQRTTTCSELPKPDVSTTHRQRVQSEGDHSAITGLIDYKKGLLVSIKNNVATDTKLEILQIVESTGFVGQQLKFDNEKLVMITNGGDVEMVMCEQRHVHPVFAHPSYNHVFHSLEDVLTTLNSGAGSDESLEYLQTLARRCEIGQKRKISASSLKPFIVIEGLDATGKSSVVDAVVKRLNGKKLQTPPVEMLEKRPLFDDSSKPDLFRRLYYYVGNYVASEQIRDACKTQPVIMDRFWQSTTAYAMATDCAVGDITLLPPEGDPIYQWPRDLCRPNLVLLLSVSEGERNRRLAARESNGGVQITKEEKVISKDKFYRERIMAAYRRVSGVEVITIEADDKPEVVQDRIMDVLESKGLFTPDCEQ